MYQQLIKDGTGQSQKILDSCRYNLLLIRRWRTIQQHLFSKDAIRQLPITSARIGVLTSPTELRCAEGLPGVLSSLQNQSFSVRRHGQSSALGSSHGGDCAIKQSSLNKIWVKSSAFRRRRAVMSLTRGTGFRLRRAHRAFLHSLPLCLLGSSMSLVLRPGLPELASMLQAFC